MPTLQRLCDTPSCGAKAVRGSKYCLRCKAKSMARAKMVERSRPSAADRGYDKKWRMIRANYLRRNPTCECGAVATEVDHVKPLVKGGANRDDNLEQKCKSCHSRKSMSENRGPDGRVQARW